MRGQGRAFFWKLVTHRVSTVGLWREVVFIRNVVVNFDQGNFCPTYVFRRLRCHNSLVWGSVEFGRWTDSFAAVIIGPLPVMFLKHVSRLVSHHCVASERVSVMSYFRRNGLCLAELESRFCVGWGLVFGGSVDVVGEHSGCRLVNWAGHDKLISGNSLVTYRLSGYGRSWVTYWTR